MTDEQKVEVWTVKGFILKASFYYEIIIDGFRTRKQNISVGVQIHLAC